MYFIIHLFQFNANKIQEKGERKEESGKSQM